MSDERVAVDVQEFTLVAGPWETVYTPPGAPLEIPITLINQGPDTVEVWTSISNAVLPLPAGAGMKCNSSGVVKARAKTTTALLTAAFGVDFFFTTAVNSDGLSAADVRVITTGNTKLSLLARILIELKINNEYHRRAQDEEVHARDLGRDKTHFVETMT